MVSMVIGSDIARLQPCWGAAIVRFRTVVEDTRDTAFVIFAVIAGNGGRSGAYRVAAFGIPVVAVMAWALRAWGANGKDATGPTPPGKLVVRLGIGPDPNGPLTETLRKHTAECRLIAIGTARQGAAIDLTYSIRLQEGTTPFGVAADVNRVEGVQGVEWGEGKKEEG